ncbi:hypothetical protein [Peptostreptococcus stomatis]
MKNRKDKNVLWLETEQREKHFNTLLFCGFEKSTKNKVHRGLRGSSPLEQIKML